MSQTARREATTRSSTSQTPAHHQAHDVELVDDLDALLDEIDSVLEDNALETVRLYIQKPGQ